MRNPSDSNPALVLSFGIVFWISTIAIGHSIGFIFGISMGPAWTIVSSLAALIVVFLRLSRLGRAKALLLTLSLVLVCLVSVWISSIMIDTSGDGNSYHKFAIGKLAHGWNPLREDSTELWSTTYPKASWIFAGSIYQLTGNIESGKALALVLVVATALAAYSYLRSKLQPGIAVIVSLLLACNPVTIMQFNSYFIDGVLGNLLIMLIIWLTILIDDSVNVNRLHVLILIVMTIVLACNIKFTGILYAGIIGIVYLAYLLFRRHWVQARRLSVAGIVSLVVGLFIVGSSSYVVNVIRYGNPFYPLLGEGKIDIMLVNQPANYDGMSTISKFLYVNFGASDNIRNPTGELINPPSDVVDEMRFKVPFNISPHELEIFGYGPPDIRQAGYGVWFGGILLLSLIFGIALLLRHRKALFESGGRVLWPFVLPMIAVGLTALIVSESWWSRYLPHLFVVPIAVLVGLLISGYSWYPRILMFALLFNSILILVLSVGVQVRASKGVVGQFESHLVCDERPIIVTDAIGDFYGARYNFQDLCPDITFDEVVLDGADPDPDWAHFFLNFYISSEPSRG